MPQHDIVKHLSKHRGKRFTAAQLSEALDCCQTSISCSVGKLVRYGIVKNKVVHERCMMTVRGIKFPYRRRVRKIWL